jgi:uncharacterized protein YkwD
MTLVAAKKPPSHHKKTSGGHHRHTKSYHKPYWPYLPLIAVVAAGLLLNALWPASHHAVLDYATDMSVQSLLDDTNSQRGSNGLGNLGLNAQLDQAAQAKANDMVARDYWSHNTPDGQAPWTFIVAAGYSYSTAGENLAYGFTTASDTLTGWMNSPGHRANILNTTYQEVGFGIANGVNYQGSGPETVVVAMYAKPATAVAAAPAPAATTPVATTPTPKTVSGSSSQSAAAGAAASPTAPTPAAATSTPATENSNGPVSVTALVEPKAHPISQVQLITAGDASWSGLAISLVVAVCLVLFLLRHAIAWHKVIRKGERFILKHPWLDTAIVAVIVAGLLLSRVSGVIR